MIIISDAFLKLFYLEFRLLGMLLYLLFQLTARTTVYKHFFAVFLRWICDSFGEYYDYKWLLNNLYQ